MILPIVEITFEYPELYTHCKPLYLNYLLMLSTINVNNKKPFYTKKAG
jgi:hypothetical protein